MTNTNPSDNNSSPSRKLGFDEFIAIFVAFTSIGTILWWSLSRQNTGWYMNLSHKFCISNNIYY
ncbi:hypothetical protein RintRC_6066 [Richelia intracellularis]|nr:hypothetical protein RintRC_6066 [Richelia intracellularis]